MAFDPVLEDLPAILPIFPLSGVLLLPRGPLPLNIFEPRYLAMTADALAQPQRLIGMVQPEAGQENRPVPGVYRIGCAGRITQFQETDDGRYLITLSGVCRFRIVEEMAGLGGYRRIKPDWTPFAEDLEEAEAGGIDRERLVTPLKSYFRIQKIEANWDAIRDTPDDRLVNSLSMVCPFSPAEKQALLEAPDLPRRAEILTALLEMAVLESGAEKAGTQ